MMTPSHHIPEPMMAAYVSGNLPYPYAMVLATHVSMCDECRARYEAHMTLGGAVLETIEAQPVSAGLKSSILAMLDDPTPPEPPAPTQQGIYPAPLSQLLGPEGPRWRKVGMGNRQSILSNDEEGSLRLLYIPAGQAVPEHSHNGIELTLVLQGSFSDEGGTFGVGDLEVADESDLHIPTAGPEAPCICLAATDAPLKFSSMIPRLMQPILKI
ncbi:ChrR family anti-sigma-E factor [Shimia biformata]|uniref:ChrR family anti-sigma-E factor n=1 Tax=Shimia biformata TaxID=1294299 RepID=UPI0019510E72|nr:ChrR family anti-sigma-E factor [Shimia biformata]